MLPHRCWDTWRNVRALIEGTDTGSVDQLTVTHLVNKFAWIFWNPKVRYHNCNSLLVIAIHSEPNQACTFRLYNVHHPLFTLWICLSAPSDIFCSGSLSQIAHPFVVFPLYIALPNHLVISMISGFCCAVMISLLFWDFTQCRTTVSYWLLGHSVRSSFKGQEF